MNYKIATVKQILNLGPDLSWRTVQEESLFLIIKAANRSKITACSVKLETLHNEMLETMTEKVYSNNILKTIKIQYPGNMAQETEETGTKPVLGTRVRSAKKPKGNQYNKVWYNR